jgi:hypothetical protein
MLYAVQPAAALVTATRSGVTLPTRNYPAETTVLLPVTVTVAGEAGFTISATLDGNPLPLGPAVVSSTGYHEVTETRVNLATSASTTSVAFQFIILGPGRGTTEVGIPMMEPLRLVNDAPSALSGQVLEVMAPALYPLNLPVPVSLRLKKGAGPAAGDPLFLNATVSASNYPSRPTQIRRGWGSTILPPATTAGSLDFNGSTASLTDTAPIQYEASTTWTAATGNLTGAVVWPAASRRQLQGVLTVKAGATLTIGAGSVIRAAAGAEIWVEPGGTVLMNGTVERPIAVVPDNTAAPWGGVWLQQTTTASPASFTATGTLFCCWGANPAWYGQAGITPSRTIFSRHRQEQPCFAIATGSICRLTDCALIGPVTPGEKRGAGFATRDGQLLLTRTSMQRVITGGEQEGGTVEIDSCALLECNEPNTNPDDGTAFDDLDNDGIYFVPGSGRTWHVTKTVIGWTKDDGIDCGGGGPGTVICEGCWFENCVHEAFSNSGSNRVPVSRNGVHINCGQGMECGYSEGSPGPQSLLDHCLVAGNMVGARYGDNYQFASYEGTMTVQNSLLLHNLFRDAWAIEWRTASNWNQQDARLVAKGSKFTRAADLARQQGAEDSPASSLWNPATDSALITPFMPVPDRKVGVALLHSHFSDPLALYPGTFTVRLSTFSSLTVSVPWQALIKPDLHGPEQTTAASGTLTFLPGETVKTFSAPLPGPGVPALVRIALLPPVNAEITGQDAWFFNTPPLPSETVLAKASSGWSYYANRVPAANAQRPPADAASLSWTAPAYAMNATWKSAKTAPMGWGNLGAASPFLVLGTTLPDAEKGITTYFRRTFSISDPDQVRALKLEMLSDDGAVAFINGVAFPPVNLNPGTDVGGISSISSDKLTTNTKADSAAEVTFDILTADSSILSAMVAGVNVLAIEVHQGSATSGDMVCDAALTLTLNPPGSTPFSLFRLDQAPWLYWDDPALILESSPDLNQWLPERGATPPFAIRQDDPRRFFRVRK